MQEFTEMCQKNDHSQPTFQGHSRSSEPIKIKQFAVNNFLLVIYSNHGPISYCFQDKRLIWF